MKILILSDIHANMLALERIWQREKDCDMVVCAGDLVDFGFEPNEVVDWIRQHAHHCVYGNHDTLVCSIYEAMQQGDVPCDGKIQWHNASWLTSDSFDYLRSLPRFDLVSLGSTDYGLVHQYKLGSYDLMTTVQQFREFTQTHWRCDLAGLILGHSHRPEMHAFMGDYHWINPGSVSYRKDDDPSLGAHYVVSIDGKHEWRFIEGDYHEYYKRLEQIELSRQQLCRVGWKFRAMADMHASPVDWPAGRTV